MSGASERVAAIAADGTLTLESSGQAVLADVLFPDAALAQTWMAAHLLQRPLVFAARDEDRYGRALIRSDAEVEALRDGVAVAYGSEEIPPAFLVAEAQAHREKRGLWALPDFVLAPVDTPHHLQQFHVVEGVVTHVYRGRDGVYLNFGEDWHNDFSAMIPKRVLRRFALLDRVHEGSHVRVRGALMQENGPLIRLSRPEQLEIL